jgi:hypothetical protein
MDGSSFDRLARAVGAAASRRRLLGALTGQGLGSVVAILARDDAAAEKPSDRLRRRKQQHRRKRRNSKRRNNGKHGNNRNGNGGGLGSGACVATGDDCSQDSDCCTSNCFNFACAEKVKQCSAGGTTVPCRPAAKGCAGSQCCHGALSCNDGCCSTDANQCNAEGNCCVPNCSGKSCGPDGCGVGGTCGSCPAGSTCDDATGACSCVPDCTNVECGSDGCGGTCGTCSDGICQDGACQPCDVCPACTYKTIQEAISDTQGPELIFICPGTYLESLNVSRNVLLFGAGQGEGPGDTIVSTTDDQEATIAVPDGVAAQLQGLRITGSKHCGVAIEDAELTMTDCTVTGNTNDDIGPAGIFAMGGTLTLKNCTISDNRVDSERGAVNGGGIGIDDAEVTLTNCVVADNKAISSNPAETFGGGIFVAAGGKLTLRNTQVTRNFTNGLGGGLYVDQNSSATLENGSTVTLNDPTNCAGKPVAGCSG